MAEAKVVMSFQAPISMHEALLTEANKRRVSLSDVIREALQRHVDHRQRAAEEPRNPDRKRD